MSMEPLDIGVLGPLRVAVGGRELVVGSVLARRLLGLLVCRVNVPLPADVLVGGLWEDPPASAAGNLRGYVARLRRSLGTDRVVRDGRGYRLAAAGGEVDVLRFEELVRSADAAGDPAGAVGLLDEALGLWRGEAYADVADVAWVAPVVERLGETRLVAVERRLEAGLVLGRGHDLVGTAQRWVREFPRRERVRGLLMLALYRSDRRGEALEVFERGRRLLAEETGLVPGADLERLNEAIANRDPRLESGGWPEFGEVLRVPSARGAEHVVPAELPPDPAVFSGREAEVELLHGALPAGERRSRPAVIAGVGGVGKSALAVHVGHRIASRFPDGQLYVDLRGSTPGAKPVEPAEALARLLRSLGVADGAIPSNVDEAAGRFRSITEGKRLLIMLDNALDSAQVRPLLPASATCAVMVTSRRVLTGVEGALLVRLDVLDEADGTALLGRLVGADRLEPAAAEVVRECGGLPLAICVAAARLNARPAWTLETLAARLATAGRRLSELEAGDRGVRAGFGVSYGELSEAHRRLFRLLGLLDGVDVGVGVAGALAGLADDRVEALLDDLADVQLAEDYRPGRYRMHDLIRLFARERAAEEEAGSDRAAAVQRAMHHYLATARAASRRLQPQARWRLRVGPEDLTRDGVPIESDADAYAWLDGEAANLPGVLRQCADDLPEAVMGLAAVLYALLVTQGRQPLLLPIGEAAAVAAGHTGDDLHRAVAHDAIGVALKSSGRLPEAVIHLTESLGAYRAAGHTRGEINQLGWVGACYRQMARFDEALASLNRSLELERKHGVPFGEAVTLGNIGLTYTEMGRYDDAIGAHLEALAIAVAQGNAVVEAAALGNIGEAHRRAGRPEEGIRRIREGLRVDERSDRAQTYGSAERRWRLGQCHHDLGELAEAKECRRRAAAVLHQLDMISADERRAIEDADDPEPPEVIRRTE